MDDKKTDMIDEPAQHKGYEPAYVPFTKLEIPKPIADVGRGFDEGMEKARAYALEHTPAPIVNMNSQINGALHVAAEISMFKASGVKFLKPKDGQKVNHLTDPPRNLWRGMTGADKDKMLQNSWSTRSTMAGFGTWTYSTFMPEKKNKLDEIGEYTKLAKENPTGYAGKKLFEGVQFGNNEHLREQIGLGVSLAGIASFISGFQNVNLKTGKRFVNPSHAIGGAVTALAGASLMLGRSDKEGWQNFGHFINLRIPLLLMSIRRKHVNGDRWGTYALGQAFFQGAAVYSSLYGGAQKLADGTVIDHDVDDVKAHLAEKKVGEVAAKPENQVSDIKERETLKDAPEMAVASA